MFLNCLWYVVVWCQRLRKNAERFECVGNHARDQILAEGCRSPVRSAPRITRDFTVGIRLNLKGLTITTPRNEAMDCTRYYNGGCAIKWSSSRRHNGEGCEDVSLDERAESCLYLRRCLQKPRSTIRVSLCKCASYKG